MARVQIEALEEGCVRIRLTPQEAAEHGLHPAADRPDDAVRAFLKEMLDAAALHCGFGLRSRRLLAQLYEQRDGSITLYLTAVETGSEVSSVPYLYRFACCEDMLNALLGLFALHCRRVFKTSLYCMNGLFYAAVYLLAEDQGQVTGFLSEYGTLWGKDARRLAYLEEHGDRILADNAMDVITYYLS